MVYIIHRKAPVNKFVAILIQHFANIWTKGSGLQTLQQKHNFSCESPYWYLWANLDETLQPFCNTQDHNTSAVGKDLFGMPEVSIYFHDEDQLSNIPLGGGILWSKLAPLCEGTGTILGFTVSWVCGSFLRMVVTFGYLYIQLLGWIKVALPKWVIPLLPLTIVCVVGGLRSTWSGFLLDGDGLVGGIQEHPTGASIPEEVQSMGPL